jgi:GNAT superfamily N-acetyltransferase
VERCRRAQPDDLARIAALERELHAELAAMRGGEIWAARDARAEPLEPVLRALLDDSSVCVVVGTIDEVIVGFGIVALEPLPTGAVLARMDELFVEEEARAVGVGEAMCAALVAFAVEHDCIGIDTLALPGHRVAKNFFEDQGFTARALTMHHSLRPAPE